MDVRMFGSSLPVTGHHWILQVWSRKFVIMHEDVQTSCSKTSFSKWAAVPCVDLTCRYHIIDKKPCTLRIESDFWLLVPLLPLISSAWENLCKMCRTSNMSGWQQHVGDTVARLQIVLECQFAPNAWQNFLSSLVIEQLGERSIPDRLRMSQQACRMWSRVWMLG